MTLVPLTQCCLALGVDPKTLRLWLQGAQLACCLHPEDARKKCLTLAQLQQVAQLHGRPLPSALLPPVASPACVPANEQGSAPLSQEPDQAEAGQQLRLLQQQVSALQAQVTELALLLVRASLAQACPPLTTACALPATPGGAAACAGPTAGPAAPVTAETAGALPTEPVRTRTRSRALPLIQVRADGSVVAIAPNEGVLSLLPDTPEWFAWLSSLSGFLLREPSGPLLGDPQVSGGAAGPLLERARFDAWAFLYPLPRSDAHAHPGSPPAESRRRFYAADLSLSSSLFLFLVELPKGAQPAMLSKKCHCSAKWPGEPVRD